MRAAETNASRVMVLGDNRMKAFGRGKGLNIVREEADLVVLLRDTRFTYAKLERAANSLREGARLIVANPDLTHPGLKDRLVPETGALLAALMACAGSRHVEMEIIGKPSPRLFEKACQALRVPAPEAVMIGDNPDTDIAGAERAGLRSVLIGSRSGVSFETLLGAQAP
jgi:4-nitrophenyl phosphatase